MFGKKENKPTTAPATAAPTENSLDVQKQEEEYNNLVRNKKTIKDLIAPSGIDASEVNHMAIMSGGSVRYARSHYVAGLPRMATFPYFLRAMYNFGDINTSVFINPISEATSQNSLNKIII